MAQQTNQQPAGGVAGASGAYENPAGGQTQQQYGQANRAAAMAKQ